MFTNSISLGRSLIALSFLLTLIFNNWQDLIPRDYFEKFVLNQRDIFNIFSYFTYDSVKILVFIAFIVFCLVISGYYPRYTCIPHAIFTYGLFKTFVILEGGDQIASNLTILLIPLLIFDRRKNSWCESYECNLPLQLYIINTFYWLILIQVCYLYFNASVGKYVVNEWSNGTAMYYWLNHNMFGIPENLTPFFNYFLSNKYICSYATYSILILELIISFSILANSTYKQIAFLCGVILHFGIFVLLGLPTFMLSMYGALVLFTFNLNTPISNNILTLKSILSWRK